MAKKRLDERDGGEGACHDFVACHVASQPADKRLSSFQANKKFPNF